MDIGPLEYVVIGLPEQHLPATMVTELENFASSLAARIELES